MNHRNLITGLLALGLSLSVVGEASLARADEAKRFEIDIVFGYGGLLGDTQDGFDDGPLGGVAFEFALNEPRDEGAFRALAIRVVGGYASFGGSAYDADLEGALLSLDAMLVANVNDMIKPYGFLGFGSANLSDDYEIVTGSDGMGFLFGVGCKFYFGETFGFLAELSHQDYPVSGSYSFSPSHVNFVHYRLGIGFRF